MQTVSTLTDARTTRAAIYTRVSTEDQAETGHSLGEQERRALDLISREGWTHAGAYEDAGISGALASRPQLDRMLAAIAAGQIDVVIVYALDRLGRDAGMLRELLLLFDAAGVRVIAAGQQLDRLSPEGRLQTGILAEFAEFERAKIKTRTKAGITGAVRKGKPWGRYPAYGYRRGDDGHWIIDAGERPTHERIFRERVEYGRSYSAIAKLLSGERVPTRTSGANWTSTLVRKILAGRYGLGEFRHNGEWITGRHEPLIEVETWEAAQALAALGAKFVPSKGGRRPTSSHVFINGILRCTVCFEAMLPRSNPDRYMCRTNVQIKGAGGCSMPSHKREDVDRLGLEMFERAFLDLDSTREHVTADLRARADEIDAQHTRAVAEEATAADRLARVRRDYTNGKIDADEWREFRTELESEHTAAVAERDRLAGSADAVGRAALSSTRRELSGAASRTYASRWSSASAPPSSART